MGDFRNEFRIFFLTMFAILALMIGAIIYFKLDSLHKDHVIRQQALIAKHLAATTRKEAQHTTKVLCSLHDNFKARIPRDQKALNRGKRFARQHPHGALGFTHAQIILGLQDDQAILNNLKSTTLVLGDLRCAKVRK